MRVPWYLMAKGKGGGGYKTASGPIVSVNDALAAPLRSLVANIEPVQDLHGYQNPWPAGGGKNLFGFEEYLKANNVAYTKNGNTYTVTIADSSLYQNPWVFSDANVAVTISASAYTAGTATNPRIDLLNSDESVVGNISPAYLTNRGTACKARINWSTIGTFTISEPMIELGDTKTSFAPYSNICPISGRSAVNVWVKPTYDPTENPTATIQLDQTVYGGTLDVTNGVLTVDRAMVDLGTLNYSAGFSGFYTLGIKDDIKVPTAIAQSNLQSDIFIVGNTSNADNMYIQITGEYVGWVVFLPSATYATPADFKTAMNGHQLVYELAAPITIPLTATQISTLQGENNVWADSGDVTVEYLASGGANADLMKLAVAFMGKE